MKIQYALKKDQYNKDEILFKVRFSNKSIGYCSYSSWQSLGQIPASDIFNNIDNELVALCLKNILRIAWRDSFFCQKVLKSRKVIAFKNHSFLSSDNDLVIYDQNIIKVKLTGDILIDSQRILKVSESFKLIRLDANFKYNYEDLLKFLDKIDRKKIEFIEDPFPWDLDQYQKINNQINVAIDHPLNNYNYKLCSDFVEILKPSVNFGNYSKLKRCIFTHNMGSDLALWHNYCDLISYGNLDLVHGIAKHSQNLFKVQSELAFLNLSKIVEIYESLNFLDNWSDLEY